MKNIIYILAISLFYLPTSAVAESSKDSAVLIFTGEVRNFMEEANSLYSQQVTLPDDVSEEKIEKLIDISHRVAHAYFHLVSDEKRPKIEKFFQRQLDQNRHLENYFVLLGNRFLIEAERQVKDRDQFEKRVRYWSTIGGSVLGLGVGGTYLYIRSSLGSGLKIADYLAAATAVAGGTAGGYFGAAPAITTYALPAEPAIQNARDFQRRYPSGEDFLEDIDTSSRDLERIHSELERDMKGY